MKKEDFQNGSAKAISLAVVALIIIIGAIGYFNSSKKDDAITMADNGNDVMMEGGHNGDAMMEEGEAMMKDDDGDAMMKDDSMMMSDYKGELLAGKKSFLLDFNQSDYEKALESGKLVLLIFHANWCSVCKAEFPEEQAAFNNLDTDKVIGFRVNYKDTETDDAENALAKEFNITIQHTKIFLKDGKQVLKSPESWDQKRFADEIMKSL